MDTAGREAHQWVVPLVLANLQINFRGCWSAGGGPRQKLAVRLRLAPHIRRFHCAPEAHPAARTRAVSVWKLCYVFLKEGKWDAPPIPSD